MVYVGDEGVTGEQGLLPEGEGLRILAGQENTALQVYCPLKFSTR